MKSEYGEDIVRARSFDPGYVAVPMRERESAMKEADAKGAPAIVGSNLHPTLV